MHGRDARYVPTGADGAAGGRCASRRSPVLGPRSSDGRRLAGVPPLAALLLLAAAACGDRAAPNAPRTESDSAVRAARSADYTASVDAERWIGMRFPPQPGGVERLAAAVRMRQDTTFEDPLWLFTSVRVGGRPMLWLSRVVERRYEPAHDSAGLRMAARILPTNQVEDALVLPRMEVEERLELWACRTPDGYNVAAIGPYSDVRKTLGRVRWARGLDTATGRLREVDPRRVRCHNPAADAG